MLCRIIYRMIMMPLEFRADRPFFTNIINPKLGISKAFGSGANFSKILKSPVDLYVSNIFHKACIEVNEEGCEAAAATSMIMMCRMVMMPLEFRADRPFLYMIWNKKNILFAGAFVNDPQ